MIKTKVYICSGKNVSVEEKEFLDQYVSDLEKRGYKVYYPLRDTNYFDPVGLYIYWQNKQAILEADEVHVYWSPESERDLFDIGMFFMAGKSVRLINKDKVTPTNEGSLANILLKLDEISNLSLKDYESKEGKK